MAEFHAFGGVGEMSRRKKPAAGKAPEGEVSAPGKGLANGKHERFAVLVARSEGKEDKDKLSNTECYLAVYGRSSLKAAESGASRLLRNAKVAARVKWLKERAAALATKELGVDKVDLARVALGYVTTPVTDVLEAVQLWGEKKWEGLSPEEAARQRHLLLQADSVKAGMFGYEVRLPKKLDAISQVCKIMKWTSDDINLKAEMTVNFGEVMERVRKERAAKIAARAALAKR